MGILSILFPNIFSSTKDNLDTKTEFKETIIFHDSFLLMGTNYHKKEAYQVADFLSGGEHYFGKDNKYLKDFYDL